MTERTYQDESGPYLLHNEYDMATSQPVALAEDSADQIGSAQEHERLDMQSNAMCAIMRNQPFHAPLSSPKTILDVGCGTGAMTARLAALYPDAKVIGIDLAPVPESRHGTRPNLEYVQGDICDLVVDGDRRDARFAPGSFDYIFHRLLLLGITDWPAYVAKVVGLLKPGGWLELQEISMKVTSPGNEHHHVEPWWCYDMMCADAAAIGLDLDVAPKLSDRLAAAGLVNVGSTMHWIPVRIAKEETQLLALKKRLLPVLMLIMDKVSSSRREAEVLGKMKEDATRRMEDATDDEKMCMVVVVGQKAAE